MNNTLDAVRDVIDARVVQELVEGIAVTTQQAHSEEDLRIGVEKLLEKVLGELGIDARPKYERTYSGGSSVLSGRSDAVYGRLVIEYEPVRSLRGAAALEHAAEQLDRYLRAESGGDDDALRRVVGVGLDGESIFFVRYRRGAAHGTLLLPGQQTLFLGEATAGQQMNAYVIGPHRVSTASIGEFLLYMRALRRRPLTAGGLAEEFGPKGVAGRQLVSSLLIALQANLTEPKTSTFFREWNRIFGIVYGEELRRPSESARLLAESYGMPSDTPLKHLLFVVHTYYALLMKLLAVELASLQAGALMTSFIADLPSVESSELRSRMVDLENGGVFANLGVRNFLEGDFFSWYLSVWTDGIEAGVRGVARGLSDFEPATESLAPESTRDLLKKLYQYLLPSRLRHDLGEYYTPDWLAELVLDEASYTGDTAKRLLDPACGSGTFLVLAIRRARSYADERLLDQRETAEAILANIVGFDLNPLAVIAARTNYLFALGGLVRHLAPIEIPVYLCDSVLTPSAQKDQTSMLESYSIGSSVGSFPVPRATVASLHLPRLSALIEECVTAEYTPGEFLKRAKHELPEEEDVTTLDALYRKILDLEAQGKNGIWARIIKNSFAPIFAGSFDFVIGNPPWVRWTYLAPSYRDATKTLWFDYGLFSLKGLSARLGGGEKDFSMLFVYACADNYLRTGGTLGFVITQEVMKSKGAGEGFRRFKIGEDGPSLKVVKAHDLVAVAPFEGAANKTAMLVLTKGDPTTYPIPYTRWQRRKGVGLIPTDASLAEAEDLMTRSKLIAQPVGEKATASWQSFEPKNAALLDKLRGASHYKARRGASTEPYGVYWLELLSVRPDGLIVVRNRPDLGKRAIKQVERAIEPDLVYPGIRGADIGRWSATSGVYVLVAQDPTTRSGYPEDQMKTQWPQTYRYLRLFERELLSRGSATIRELAEKTVFWTMYGIGPYSVAPYRVIWRRMAGDMIAAVISTASTPFGERSLIGTDTTAFVPFESEEEAHYLCGLLNSTPFRTYVASYSAAGRGFGAPSVIEPANLPQFDAGLSPHRTVAALSKEAHERAAEGHGRKLRGIETELDDAARQLWGIDS